MVAAKTRVRYNKVVPKENMKTPAGKGAWHLLEEKGL